MSATTTPNLGLSYPDTGTEDNAWGDLLNAIFDQLDDMVGGVLSKSVAGGSDVTLTAGEAAHHSIYLTGTLTASINVVVPAKQRNYRIFNNTTGAYTITVKTAAGAGVGVVQGDKALVSCDGSDCIDFMSGKLSKAGGQMTGAINEAKGTDIASGASIDLGAATGNFVDVTGTATITALGTVAAGARRRVRFTGAATVVHNGTSLLLPGAANLSAQANDGAEFVSLGSGNWWCSGVRTGTFPSGTKMLFQQTSAPTGWTKDTTHNDKALRVVSGAASSGGATAFTAVFGASKTTGAHTLTIAEMPLHGHPFRTVQNTDSNLFGFATGQATPTNRAAFTGTPANGTPLGGEGGGGSHDHTLSLDLQYVDLIIATKD